MIDAYNLLKSLVYAVVPDVLIDIRWFGVGLLLTGRVDPGSAVLVALVRASRRDDLSPDEHGGGGADKAHDHGLLFGVDLESVSDG